MRTVAPIGRGNGGKGLFDVFAFFQYGVFVSSRRELVGKWGGEGRERGEGTKREKEEDPPQPHQVGLPSFGQVTCLHIFLLLFLKRVCEGNQLMISAEDGSRTNEKKKNNE